MQVRGDAEPLTDAALGHLDAVTCQFTRHTCYHGHTYPLEWQARETRVIVRLRAAASPRRDPRLRLGSRATTIQAVR